MAPKCQHKQEFEFGTHKLKAPTNGLEPNAFESRSKFERKIFREEKVRYKKLWYKNVQKRCTRGILRQLVQCPWQTNDWCLSLRTWTFSNVDVVTLMNRASAFQHYKRKPNIIFNIMLIYKLFGIRMKIANINKITNKLVPNSQIIDRFSVNSWPYWIELKINKCILNK